MDDYGWMGYGRDGDRYDYDVWARVGNVCVGRSPRVGRLGTEDTGWKY